MESLLERQGVSCGSLWGQRHWRQRYWVIIISMSFPGGRHLGARTRPQPTPTVGSSAGKPQAKQPKGWEHSRTHPQTGCLKTSRDSPLDTPLDTALPARARVQLHPPVGRPWPLPPGSLHKLPAFPTRGQKPEGRKLFSRIRQPEEPSLQTQTRTYPGTSWILALG